MFKLFSEIFGLLFGTFSDMGCLLGTFGDVER
jgi:hypothetical protein